MSFICKVYLSMTSKAPLTWRAYLFMRALVLTALHIENHTKDIPLKHECFSLYNLMNRDWLFCCQIVRYKGCLMCYTNVFGTYVSGTSYWLAAGIRPKLDQSNFDLSQSNNTKFHLEFKRISISNAQITFKSYLG